MTYKELKKKIKEEQKALAEEIKYWKSMRKPSKRDHSIDQWDVDSKLFFKKREFRCKHIAYCEFFNNTPYEKIEQPRADNKPSKLSIDNFKNEWQKLLDWDGQIIEALRNCA